MSYLPELRDALHSAAARHTGHLHARNRPRWRTRSSRAILVAAVLPSIALAVFLLTDIRTAPRKPSSPGTPPAGVPAAPAAWLRAERKAFEAVYVHQRSCQLSQPIRGTQHMLDRAPGQQFTSMLRVLHRPPPIGARLTAARIRQLHVLAQDVYVRYARHGVVDGVTYYLIPAARDIGGKPLSNRCAALYLAAFTKQVEKLGLSQPARAIAWERQRIREKQEHRAGVALLTFTPGGSQDMAYLTLSDLHRRPFMGASGGTNHITTTALVLPDKVATVTARYGAQTYPGRVPRPVTVTRMVVNNLVIFVFRGAWDPPELTYRSASGALLASVGRFATGDGRSR